jgi:hypothetical protein
LPAVAAAQPPEPDDRQDGPGGEPDGEQLGGEHPSRLAGDEHEDGDEQHADEHGDRADGAAGQAERQDPVELIDTATNSSPARAAEAPATATKRFCQSPVV